MADVLPLDSGTLNAIGNYNPAGFALRNQGMQAQNDALAAETQGRQAQTRQTQLQNQQLQIAMRDQQLLGQAWRDGQGNPDAVFKNFVQAGGSPQGAMQFQTAQAGLRKAIAEAYKDEQAGRSNAWNNEKDMNAAKGAAYSSMLTPDGQGGYALNQGAVPGALQRLKELDPEHTPPANLNADSVQAEIGKAGYMGTLLDQAKTQGATAKEQQATAAARRAQAIQELSGVVDPSTGKVNPQAYAQWTAKYPEMKAPALPSDGYVADQIRSGVPIEKQPEYLIQQRLQSMKPEDFQDRIDGLNLPPALKGRTEQLVGQALNFGDKKSAMAVIKDASDQLGRTETAVRTAQATAPIKVTVNTTEAANKKAQFMVPDGKGGYLMQNFGPGDSIPAGAVSASGMNSMNVPTANTRSMAEKAPRVVEFVDRINQLLNANEKQLGPLSGRWNEFTAGKVGVPNQGYTQLRTDTALLQTALMNMHVGARGGEQMMEHFKDLIDTAKQSPENLRAALGEIKDYAQRMQAEGHAQQQAGGNQGNNQPKATKRFNPATGKLEDIP